MKIITVQVREDHLENLARTKPMNALAELIWNALDAEATEVRVEFEENELQGTKLIRIVDNGNGLHYDDAFIVFQNLGGSWKRSGTRTHDMKRTLHGKYGKGRFRAFSLGNQVEWRSTYIEAGDALTFSIQGGAAKLGEFTVSGAKRVNGAPSGMVVEIHDPPVAADVLRGVKAMQEVTDIFALYLRQYPGVKIVYDHVPLDPANSEVGYTDYTLDEIITENGDRVAAEMTVVEWNIPGKRGVYFCDGKGFMLQNMIPRLHFRGFSYTAYVKADHIAQLEREGLLQAGELTPDVRQLLDVARSKLREHFTLREAEQAQQTLEQWKEEGLYPFLSAPATESESNSRRIFDIYATHLNQMFPEFSNAGPRTRRLVLHFLKELVNTEPTRVARILDELIDFPDDKEEAILELSQAEAG
ncbi:MAG: ATP-binding protein [Candidatus Hydrogenedentes bacterium]|nr:ATP-binding protein [Candidatus Hydrogenedentota bacterium]